MARGDITVVTHPERSPAVCFITRSSVGPFIDTGVDVTLRSRPGNPVVTERVYLAVPLVQQMATLLGLTGAGEDKNRDAQLIARGKLEGLKEGLGGDLDRVVGTLSRWLDSAGGSGSCCCGGCAL